MRATFCIEPHIRCLSSFLGVHERAAARRGNAKVVYTPAAIHRCPSLGARQSRPPEVLAVRVAPDG